MNVREILWNTLDANRNRNTGQSCFRWLISFMCVPLKEWTLSDFQPILMLFHHAASIPLMFCESYFSGEKKHYDQFNSHSRSISYKVYFNTPLIFTSLVILHNITRNYMIMRNNWLFQSYRSLIGILRSEWHTTVSGSFAARDQHNVISAFGKRYLTSIIQSIELMARHGLYMTTDISCTHCRWSPPYYISIGACAGCACFSCPEPIY